MSHFLLNSDLFKEQALVAESVGGIKVFDIVSIRSFDTLLRVHSLLNIQILFSIRTNLGCKAAAFIICFKTIFSPELLKLYLSNSGVLYATHIRQNSTVA